MWGFDVPMNKNWMDTRRLWPPLSSQGYSKSPDRNLRFSVQSYSWFFSHCIWVQQPNLVLARGASSGPSLLIWETAQRWVYLKYRERNDQAVLRTGYMKNIKINPVEVSIGLSDSFCLSVRLWTYMHTTHKSLIFCLIILMALGHRDLHVTQANVQWFWFLSTLTCSHLWNNYELWVNINWQWKGGGPHKCSQAHHAPALEGSTLGCC